jgi:hypothetical protein
MDAIRELLDRLDTLTADELADLRTKVFAEADTLLDGEETPETVAALNELAEAGEKVKAQETTRAEQAAAQAAEAQAARDRIQAARGEEEGSEEEGEEETPADGEEDEAPAAEAEAPAEGAEVAVAASAGGSGAVARMAAAQGRPAGSPERRPAETPNRAVLTASGNYSPITQAGEEIPDSETLARMMSLQLSRMDHRSRGTGGTPVIVASATWEYPEERQLGSDPYLNSRKIEQAVGFTALRASGGICAPVNVDYTVDTWATADRPLRDFLPAFTATRGGLRFVKPKDIAALAGATGIWPEATDSEPGSATKPVLAVTCGTPEEVLVEAISTRLGFGNMQARFAPEQVAMNTDLAIAAAARVAEINLLELIQAKCLKDVTSGKVLGATRDLITAISQAVAAFRYTHRISRDIVFSAIFPDWVKDQIKIDIARETAHQQGGDWNALEIKEAQVEALIKNCGVNPCFVIDGLPEESGKYPLQGFASQTGTGAIHAFPTKMVWNLFPEGSIQFLDGGRLDLGVVRDSTLDATNDYETFVETFEGIADRGFENSAIQFVTELCANGKSGATETVSTCA